MERTHAGTRPLLAMICVAALYIVTARFGLAFALPPDFKATAVWPPSGIAFASLLLGGRRLWPGVWLGAFTANMLDFFSPGNRFAFEAHAAASAGIATGSTLQPLLGAWLLERWIGGQNFLDEARKAVQFTVVAASICFIASNIGVASLCLSGIADWSHYGFNWLTWWVGDSVGILIVTPLFAAWSRPLKSELDCGHAAEGVLLSGVAASIGLLVFGAWEPWGFRADFLVYLTIPPVVWAAFRFGHHGTTAALVLILSIAVWGTAWSLGPFVRQTLNESLISLQMFAGILAVTGLMLTSVLAERKRAQIEQAHLVAQLQQTLSEIKVLRGLIPICAWCKKIRDDAGLWQQLEAYLRDHSEATFSHGICPECQARLRGQKSADSCA